MIGTKPNKSHQKIIINKFNLEINTGINIIKTKVIIK